MRVLESKRQDGGWNCESYGLTWDPHDSQGFKESALRRSAMVRRKYCHVPIHLGVGQHYSSQNGRFLLKEPILRSESPFGVANFSSSCTYCRARRHGLISKTTLRRLLGASCKHLCDDRFAEDGRSQLREIYPVYVFSYQLYRPLHSPHMALFGFQG